MKLQYTTVSAPWQARLLIMLMTLSIVTLAARAQSGRRKGEPNKNPTSIDTTAGPTPSSGPAPPSTGGGPSATPGSTRPSPSYETAPT